MYSGKLFKMKLRHVYINNKSNHITYAIYENLILSNFTCIVLNCSIDFKLSKWLAFHLIHY